MFKKSPVYLLFVLILSGCAGFSTSQSSTIQWQTWDDVVLDQSVPCEEHKTAEFLKANYQHFDLCPGETEEAGKHLRSEGVLAENEGYAPSYLFGQDAVLLVAEKDDYPNFGQKVLVCVSFGMKCGPSDPLPVSDGYAMFAANVEGMESYPPNLAVIYGRDGLIKSGYLFTTGGWVEYTE